MSKAVGANKDPKDLEANLLKKPEEQKKQCSCIKFVLSLPLIILSAVLSIFFLVLWVVLMPIKVRAFAERASCHSCPGLVALQCTH